MVAALVCQHPCAAFEPMTSDADTNNNQDVELVSQGGGDAALIDRFIKDLKFYTTDSLLRLWLAPFGNQVRTGASKSTSVRLMNDEVDNEHAQESQTVIGLNNEGVKDLNHEDYPAAIKKFELALEYDPDYKLAHDNLAIAYNNFGLSLRKKPTEALKQFHAALFLNPTNNTTRQNVEGIIRMLGKRPQSFSDRVLLGDQSNSAGDPLGAVVEYSAALELKQDADLRAKLLAAFARMIKSQKMLNTHFLMFDTAASVMDVKLEPAPITSGAQGAGKKQDPDFGGYMAELQRRIKKSWSPPETDTFKQVIVIFKLKGDGALLKLRLDTTSGSISADTAALRAVEKAAPFQPLPDGAPPTVDIEFTFDYKPHLPTGQIDKALNAKERDYYAKKLTNATSVDYPFSSVTDYMTILESSIKKAWRPPLGHESKIVSVTFRVNKNGDVSDLKLYTSSGHGNADEAALQAIRDCARFAPPPQTGFPLDVQYTFDRRLNWAGKPY